MFGIIVYVLIYTYNIVTFGKKFKKAGNFFTQHCFSSILSILAASSSIFLQSAGISLR